jgi:putative membrane protein
MASESWRQLHPASVVVNLLPRSWTLVRGMWPLLLFVVYGQVQQADAGLQFFDISLLSLFFCLAAWSTILHWATLRYRVHEGKLNVKTGLLNRQVRVITPERIQNIEMVRNVFHRMSGLVEVRIETASGTEVEGLLSALRVAEAERLIEQMGKARSAPETDEVLPVLIHNSFADLLRYGATTGRLGAMALAIGVGAEWIQWTDPNDVRDVGLVLGFLGGAALVLAAFSGACVLGVGNAVVRHHGFRLTRLDAGLVAEEGLFTLRRVELPLSKVQLVTITEPILRRVLGFGSVHIETAAARIDKGGVQQSEAMVPVVVASRFAEVVRAALPELDIDLHNLQLNRPHPKALLRALLLASVRGGVVTAVLVAVVGAWGALALVFLPIGWATAWLDYSYQGWQVTDRVIVARRGWWSRRTQVLDRRKLQSMRLSQGPFLRNWGLGVLGLRVAGSAVVLPVLSWEDAEAVQRSLLRSV